MQFITIQRNLVDVLLKLPVTVTFAGRDSLLQGLPSIALTRSQDLAQLDLNLMISELNKLGRLTNEGGIRPIIVIVDNALNYVPDGSVVADELQRLKKELEHYYGGDIQPDLEQPLTDEMLEALIFGPQRDTRLEYSFIQQAQIAARSICRLEVPRIFNGKPDGKYTYGTGWIIAPGLLMTNYHVLDARDNRALPGKSKEQLASPSDLEMQVQRTVARFDYYVEKIGTDFTEYQNAKLLAANKNLDYAIIELEHLNASDDRLPLSLIAEQPTLTKGKRVNIVQYPRGGPLRYAIRNNFFVRQDMKSGFLFYQTDTEPGSSGSPVCNDDWQVIALHHAAKRISPEKVPQEVLDGAVLRVTTLNEAIQIHDILNDLPQSVRQRILSSQNSV